MGKSGEKLSAGLPIAVLLLVTALLLFSCALPQIIVMEDTLTAEQHNDLGYIYEQKGKFDLAEKEYRQAAGKRKSWYLPYFNLGNLMFQREEFKKSEKFFRTALKYEPDNPDVMNNLANVLLKMARYQEAQQIIEKALQIENKREYSETLEAISQKKREKQKD